MTDPTQLGESGILGLRLREFYAGLALHGMLANSSRHSVDKGMYREAVRHADGLVAELANTYNREAER